jgi:hypothetical protein
MTLRKKLAVLTNRIKGSVVVKTPINFLYYNKLSMLFKLLTDSGYIYGIQINKSKMNVICRLTSVLYELKFVTKGLIFISFYQVKALIYKNPMCIFFLSSSFGVIDNLKILNLKCGGYLLLILKNKNVNL